MALLGKIRNQYGFVMMGLVFIGVAGFLFMDFGPGNQGMGNGSKNIGSVNGTKISREEYQSRSQELQGRQILQEEIDKYVWERLVYDKIIEDKAVEAGFAVLKNEMSELFLGADDVISPIVRQQLANPQTRQIDRKQLKQMIDFYNNPLALSQYTPEQRAQVEDQKKNWEKLKQNVLNTRMADKYISALRSGIYVPKWLAEKAHKDNNTTYNFNYVRIPYTSIDNSTVQVSDEDLNNYIKENSKLYQREASANIEYAIFNVVATAKDSADYLDEMTSIATEFKATKDDSSFVQINDGSIDVKYLTADEFKESGDIKESILAAEEGAVFGPYILNNSYKVLKVRATKTLADSVRARHILYPVQTQDDMTKGFALLDSLKKELETNGASFDSLAVKFSKDGSASKGGDLGYKAKDAPFVPQFINYMFFTGEKDSLKIIQTQFGLHLIQITGNKFETNAKGLQIATIVKDIIPSEKTTKTINKKVNAFLAKNRTYETFKAATQAQGILRAPANGLEKGAFEITGLGKNTTAADIIKWANSELATAGSVAPRPYRINNEELNYTKQFIVPVLISKSAKGLATIKNASIRAEVDRIVRNKKKATTVQTAIASMKVLGEIATKYNVSEEVATNVSYERAYIGSIGVEPNVAATAVVTPVNQLSKVVTGKEGIYVLQMGSVSDAGASTNLKSSKTTAEGTLGRIFSTFTESLKDNATIVDERNI